MDDTIFSSLRCPVNGMRLRVASADEIRVLAPGWSEALIREDGGRIYPVESGIPLLVADAGRVPSC